MKKKKKKKGERVQPGQLSVEERIARRETESLVSVIIFSKKAGRFVKFA